MANKKNSHKINFEQFKNSKVKVLGKRWCLPILMDLAVLESVWSRVQFFIHILSPSSLREKNIYKCIEN